ncbi:MAG: site-2 protease family protein [Spirochaetales bacterium]|jgi:Zn-dependent protease|nr:site-2 protease family protein [Spirochaetales bacterium]
MLNLSLSELIKILPAVLIGLTVHEFAHAIVALKLGDNTPRELGRLTLNPIKHIDPIGFILLVIVGFGWAKPVIINRQNLKHPFRDDFLISMAGPFSNLLFALILACILKLLLLFVPFSSENMYNMVFSWFLWFIWINVGLGVFNLLPIPPLDGSHLITNLLALKNHTISAAYNKYGSYLLLGIILVQRIGNLNILPIGKVMQAIVTQIFQLVNIL